MFLKHLTVICIISTPSNDAVLWERSARIFQLKVSIDSVIIHRSMYPFMAAVMKYDEMHKICVVRGGGYSAQEMCDCLQPNYFT